MPGGWEALVTNPESPTVHVRLGNSLADGGRIRAAVRAYQYAIAIDSEFKVAHTGVIVTLREALAEDDDPGVRKYAAETIGKFI